MVRLIISFALALMCHSYIFQLNLVFSNSSPPVLISDTSVSVTLNQNRKKTESSVNQDAIQIGPKAMVGPPLETVNEQPSAQQQALPSKEIKQVVEKINRDHPPEPIEICAITPRAKKKHVKENNAQAKPQNSIQPPGKIPTHNDTAISTSNTTSNSQHSVSKAAPSSSVVEAQPLYQYNPKPGYPILARKRGWEGIVILSVDILKTGEVATVRIAESCGFTILDKSALRAVSTWRFRPGTRKLERVQSTVMIPVHFILN